MVRVATQGAHYDNRYYHGRPRHIGSPKIALRGLAPSMIKQRRSDDRLIRLTFPSSDPPDRR